MSRLFSTACERNRGPILEVLREVFPAEGLVLEVASGTGMHAVHFANALPGLRWQPTDRGAEALASIAAWRDHEGAPNVLTPLELDVTASPWPIERADAIFNANMVHISPFACAEGLFSGAAATLPDGAPMVLYGPFKIAGKHTAPSNAAFDERLRSRDPAWGIRDLEEIERLGGEAGLSFVRRIQMPANNQCLVFVREAQS